MCKYFYVVPVLLLLSACAPAWEKPGATAADFDAAQSMCEKRAEAKYPPLLHQVLRNPAYATPSHSGCFGSPALTDCLQSQSVMMPPTLETVDDNEAPRTKEIQSCLRENGWRPAD